MSVRALAFAALAAAALAAFAGCGLLHLQRALLFPGSSATLPPGAIEALGGESIWLEHAGGRSEIWWLPAARGAPGPVVVFAHGNGELVDHWVAEWEPLRRSGVSVLLVEYPGYGRSGGRPSERSIGAAMRAAYDWLVRRPDVDPRRVVGYGRSLGGGAVCSLARERALAALVLESTFTSVRDVARGLGLPGFLVADPFESLAVVRGFAGPILFVHGERDEVVPFAHAERLHAAAPGSQLRRLACGHNDCPRPWSAVLPFLTEHGLAAEVASPP